ncbi:hypothetical protein H9P43_001115 [Blastocladiella emersonii ATCC 22665]|nr:hypothetical protein H9P43_001115 [Blastocladiella emersonii ATCC 22665]
MPVVFGSSTGASLSPFDLGRAGTQHAAVAVALALLPALLGSSDVSDRPPIDVGALRTHTVLAFHTSTPRTTTGPAPSTYTDAAAALLSASSAPTVVTSSPWYTWLTYPLYHPRARHLVGHGTAVVFNVLSLDRGLVGSAATYIMGATAYAYGVVVDAAVRDTMRDPAAHVRDAVGHGRAVLEGVWGALVEGRGAQDVGDSVYRIGSAVETSVAGLRARAFGHVLYGMQGVSHTFRVAALTRTLRQIAQTVAMRRRVWTPAARRTLDERIFALTMNLVTSAVFWVPEALAASKWDGETGGLIAATVAGVASSFLFDHC